MRVTNILSLAFLGLFLAALPALADTTNPLTGTYYGSATITSPAPMGTVDLAFYLDVTGSTIQNNSSYIVLDKTLLFPSIYKILVANGAPQLVNGVPVACSADTTTAKCVEIGPKVSGTLSTSAFTLTIDGFTSTVAQKAVNMGGPGLGNLNVTRNITLANTTVTNGGYSISGTYTEIISGMGKSPITVSGDFTVIKPTAYNASSAILDANKDNCIDLAEIRAGGNNTNVIEYADISTAMHFYNNPSISPNICAPRDQLINSALTEYYNSLK